MKTPTPLKKILSAKPATQRLIQQVSDLKRLNHRLTDLLPSAIAQHYKVATAEQGTLIILAASSAWATRLRLQQAKIIKGFRDFQIKSITIQIEPAKTEISVEKPTKPRKMSPNTSKLLIDLSETTSDQKLKQALQRLSRHATKPS